MRAYISENGTARQLSNLSYMQTKQSAAIMDCIGRMIPQEGVDYETEVFFKGENSSSVSMRIKPLTDKGDWWNRYVMEMIKKYPPTIENPEQSIQEGKEED